MKYRLLIPCLVLTAVFVSGCSDIADREKRVLADNAKVQATVALYSDVRDKGALYVSLVSQALKEGVPLPLGDAAFTGLPDAVKNGFIDFTEKANSGVDFLRNQDGQEIIRGFDEETQESVVDILKIDSRDKIVSDSLSIYYFLGNQGVVYQSFSLQLTSGYNVLMDVTWLKGEITDVEVSYSSS